MAEMGSKVVMGVSPLGVTGGTTGATALWRSLVFVQAQSASNSDTITVTGLTSVIGAYVVSSGGTAGTCTFATNVITVTNGSNLLWSGLAWGT